MSTLFKPELVKILPGFASKGECLGYMAELLASQECLIFPDRFLKAILGREEIMSTGIGRGVAIPHARDITVSKMGIALCRLQKPLEYNALDDLPVNLVFMIAVPQEASHAYMQVLKTLSEYLRDDARRNLLETAATELELYNYAKDIEAAISRALAN